MEISSLFGAKNTHSVGDIKNDSNIEKNQEKEKFPPDWFLQALSAHGSSNVAIGSASTRI